MLPRSTYPPTLLVLRSPQRRRSHLESMETAGEARGEERGLRRGREGERTEEGRGRRALEAASESGAGRFRAYITLIRMLYIAYTAPMAMMMLSAALLEILSARAVVAGRRADVVCCSSWKSFRSRYVHTIAVGNNRLLPWNSVCLVFTAEVWINEAIM